MASQPADQRREVTGVGDLMADNRGENELLQDVPRGARGFLVVQRCGLHGNLSPSLLPVCSQPHEQARVALLPPETGLKGENQRQVDLPHFGAADSHTDAPSPVWRSRM